MNSPAASWSVRQILGQGDLPKLVIETPFSVAEIYLHGAHVTHFQKKGEKPLLFMSAKSQFAAGKAIRGGVPLIFPWFGAKEGSAAHGIGRTNGWRLLNVSPTSEGGAKLRFGFPSEIRAVAYPEFESEFEVEVGTSLTMRLVFHNSSNEDLSIEDCMHTYFQVGDIRQVSIQGLKGVSYLDKVDGGKSKTETKESIRIESEVDQVYLNTSGTTEILDESFRRRIRIQKEGSNSAVVWNPWVDKSKSMADFGDEEYVNMLCVECGNVGSHQRRLAPGDRVSTMVRISSESI
ncbi:MAG: D-hexose-6-phosphate mutarotase [Verrucomicrobiota bacterium]